MDPEVKVFVAAAKDVLSQAFKITCGKTSLYSSFREDTAKLYQPFTSGLYCVKEAWKVAVACPSVLPNSISVTRLGSRFRRKYTEACTSQTTLLGFFVDATDIENISLLQIFLLPKLGRRASQLTIHCKIKLCFMSLWRHPVLRSSGSKGQTLLKEVKSSWEHLKSSRL